MSELSPQSGAKRTLTRSLPKRPIDYFSIVTELLLSLRLIRTFTRPGTERCLSESKERTGTEISRPLFESYVAFRPSMSIEEKPAWPSASALTA